MKTHQEKLSDAIEYLKKRNKYIIDPMCCFMPTKPVQTDVRETILKYREEVEAQPKIKLVERKRK
jgi:hypothetical protein